MNKTISNTIKRVFGSKIAIGIYCAVLFIVFLFAFVSKFDPIDDETLDGFASERYYNDCNVVGINLHGELYTYIPEYDSMGYYEDAVSSENILGSIRRANEDPEIEAIIVEVDSAGGSPVAGEEIANAIANSEKPVISFIREVGASASYWAISSSDMIFASKNSNIGSIGVSASYLDDSQKNKMEGYHYEELTSGKYKDTGLSFRPLTEDERELYMRDVNIIYTNFIEAIATYRNLPIEHIQSIADGSTVLGDKALELVLIDAIGGIREVENHIENLIGDEIEICWE